MISALYVSREAKNGFFISFILQESKQVVSRTLLSDCRTLQVSFNMFFFNLMNQNFPNLRKNCL